SACASSALSSSTIGWTSSGNGSVTRFAPVVRMRAIASRTRRSGPRPYQVCSMAMTNRPMPSTAKLHTRIERIRRICSSSSPRAAASHLTGEAAVRLDEALVAELAAEPHVTVGIGLARGDHRGELVVQLLVELVLEQARERSVQRHAASEEEDRNPPRRDQQHPA